MTEILVPRKLEMASLDNDARYALARRVLTIMHEDYLRAQIPESEVRSIANPDEKASVLARQKRIEAADARGAPYVGLFEEGAEDAPMLAVANVGSWRHGDAKPFGIAEQVQALAANLPVVSPERRPRGLHLFSTVSGADIAKRGLATVRYNLVPAAAPLQVSAARKDYELQAALSELGAEVGPEGVAQVGSADIPVVLRKLPPLEK